MNEEASNFIQANYVYDAATGVAGGGMNAEQLEREIAIRIEDGARLFSYVAEARTDFDRYRWRVEAKRAYDAVARLVAMRSPETVRAMEESRGLA